MNRALKDGPTISRIQRLRSKGYGILKIARELGIGTSAVQRVVAAD
jgi:Helix-turn-helix domain of resolvase